MMMLVDGVIISTIVCTQKCPASQVAAIFVTSVKDIAVKVQCITLDTKQANNSNIFIQHKTWKYLTIITAMTTVWLLK